VGGLQAGIGSCGRVNLAKRRSRLGCRLGEERELAQAESRWDGAGLLDYQVEVRLGCFCEAALPVFTRLEVRAGQMWELSRSRQVQGSMTSPWRPGPPCQRCSS
jgi:hypothetical protein